VKQVLSGLKYNFLFHVHGVSSLLHDMDLKSVKRVFHFVPAGSSIIATTPYRLVKMDLKKIMALAMLALMVIPSLTMVVRAEPDENLTGDPDDGAGLADAIDRARLYLDNVRTSAETLAQENPEMFQKYLNEIYDLLDQDGEEDPENLLETTGDVGSGNEDRIRINMPEGTVLNDIVSISWDYYLYSGYAPHVDIMVDTNNDQVIDDALVVEYAYNDAVGYHMDEGQPTYGCLYNAWYTTFSDDGEGPASVTDTSYAWPTTGPAGPFGTVCHTLAQWKTGINYDGKFIDKDTPVLALEFEVDNWMAQTKAVIDNIKMNDDVIYDFEEEPEVLGAEGYLDQASAYLEGGEVNLAARSLASARNILGRVKGLLTSMIKIDKVARTERFMRQFEHRIAGLEDKINRLRGRFGEGKANSAKASMGLALGRLGQLGEDLSAGNVDDTLNGLCDIIEDINAALGTLDGDTSDILEAIDRLEAKIRVLNASSERLARKGLDTSDVDEELNDVELLLNEAVNLLEDGDTEDAETLLGQAEDLVREAGSRIQGIRKGHQDKGSKGKGKGQGN